MLPVPLAGRTKQNPSHKMSSPGTWITEFPGQQTVSRFMTLKSSQRKLVWKKRFSWNIPIIYVYDICHIYIYLVYIYIIRKYKEITPTTWNKPSCKDKCFSIQKLGAVFAHESSVKEHVKVGIWLKTTKFTVRLDEVVILLMVQKSQTTNWDI